MAPLTCGSTNKKHHTNQLTWSFPNLSKSHTWVELQQLVMPQRGNQPDPFPHAATGPRTGSKFLGRSTRLTRCISLSKPHGRAEAGSVSGALLNEALHLLGLKLQCKGRLRVPGYQGARKRH